MEKKYLVEITDTRVAVLNFTTGKVIVESFFPTGAGDAMHNAFCSFVRDVAAAALAWQ